MFRRDLAGVASERCLSTTLSTCALVLLILSPSPLRTAIAREHHFTSVFIALCLTAGGVVVGIAYGMFQRHRLVHGTITETDLVEYCPSDDSSIASSDGMTRIEDVFRRLNQ